MKRHHMQIAKQRNLSMIRKWISEAGGFEKVNKRELVRKCELVIGCTKAKAIEYLEAITGAEISL